jgi:peptide/nickel transport system substrate-binding protein
LTKHGLVRIGGALLAAAITLTACAGGGGSTSAGPGGEPVRGGTLTVVEGSEPRSLDPAVVINSGPQETAVGNALYGQLFVNDPGTSTVRPAIGQSLETTDDGTTWTVKIKPGIVYSDGSPLTAPDVKFGWERAANPQTGSSFYGDAVTIKTITVVDDLTLTVGLVRPNILFPALIWESSLNWIGKPAALQQGGEAFNAKPIGAGPFTLKEWRRGDAVELVRNDKYWDAPKPYLDTLLIKSVNSPPVRYNTLVSGGADVAMEGDYGNLDKATQAGLTINTIQTAGGTGLAFNTIRAPFDDVRARQAVSMAVDLDQLSVAWSNGKAPVPTTLFWPDQPYFADIPIHKNDKAEAQRLFDELAAEGKPLAFRMVTTGGNTKLAAESIQAQLTAFRNVKAEVQVIDIGAYTSVIITNRDWDMAPDAISTNRIWRQLSGDSKSGISKINDPEMTDALRTTQIKNPDATVKAAYATVQDRYAATAPYLLFTRQSLTAVGNKNVGGVSQYGYGSLQVENLWRQS